MYSGCISALPQTRHDSCETRTSSLDSSLSDFIQLLHSPPYIPSYIQRKRASERGSEGEGETDRRRGEAVSALRQQCTKTTLDSMSHLAPGRI